MSFYIDPLIRAVLPLFVTRTTFRYAFLYLLQAKLKHVNRLFTSFNLGDKVERYDSHSAEAEDTISLWSPEDKALLFLLKTLDNLYSCTFHSALHHQIIFYRLSHCNMFNTKNSRQ